LKICKGASVLICRQAQTDRQTDRQTDSIAKLSCI